MVIRLFKSLYEWPFSYCICNEIIREITLYLIEIVCSKWLQRYQASLTLHFHKLKTHTVVTARVKKTLEKYNKPPPHWFTIAYDFYRSYVILVVGREKVIRRYSQFPTIAKKFWILLSLFIAMNITLFKNQISC